MVMVREINTSEVGIVRGSLVTWYERHEEKRSGLVRSEAPKVSPSNAFVAKTLGRESWLGGAPSH